MREKGGSFTYYQLELPFDDAVKSKPDSRGQSRCHSRNTGRSSPSSFSRPCSRQSHSCVSIEQDTNNQNSQHILVGSALRRPHASEYSPLDYQSMPDVGKLPRQPYRSQSACTVYNYTARPFSAKEQPSKHGRHTKSSLLRCKSASSASLCSVSSTTSSKSTSSHKSSSSKRLCEIRDDYRLFKGGPLPKQIPAHGETLHGFLTGARYNRARHLDSRALSKLGVYIPKPELNSFFIRDDFEGSDARNEIFSDCLENELPSPVAEVQDENEIDNRVFSSRATNTDQHYLSITHWHLIQWKTDRKPCREPRVQSAPPLKVKAIKAFYHDYEKSG